MSSPSAPLDRRGLTAVGLVCFANVLLEVVLTRVFSAVMYYHFTFFAIALALLGMGASGVYVYVRADVLDHHSTREQMSRSARRFAVATTVAIIYILANPVVTPGGDGSELSNQAIFQLLLLATFAGLPFFYAGMVVSLAI